MKNKSVAIMSWFQRSDENDGNVSYISCNRCAVCLNELVVRQTWYLIYFYHTLNSDF